MKVKKNNNKNTRNKYANTIKLIQSTTEFKEKKNVTEAQTKGQQ